MMYSLWQEYPTFINLESQLAAMHVPVRISLRRELLEIFNGKVAKVREKGNGNAKGKGKGNAKGKGKGNGRKKAGGDASDSDGYDPEAMDESDQDAILESGDENSGEDDAMDGESAAERLERRTRDKDNAQLRATNLKVELDEFTGALTNAPKSKKAPTRNGNFDAPWTRVSRFSSDMPDNSFRGQLLNTFHTFEWTFRRGASFARNMKDLAAICITESSAIVSYRPALLFYNTEKGAANLRSMVEMMTKEYRVEDARVGTLRQTTLLAKMTASSSTSRSAPLHERRKPRVALRWADGLYLDKAQHDTFDLHVELQKLKRSLLMGKQEDEVQKLVEVFEATRVSWQDATGHANAKERPAIEPALQKLMAQLVKVSQIRLSIHVLSYEMRRSVKTS
jgi:hypothetical protein